jgi:hypothetical protein
MPVSKPLRVGGAMEPTYRDSVCADGPGVTRWLQHEARFRLERVGDTTFYVAPPPRVVVEEVMAVVEEVVGGPSVLTTAVARCSTETEDAQMRIHTDAGMGCSHAWVWYGTNPPEERVPFFDGYGTAFFAHRDHGLSFRGTRAEHDRLLVEDAGDLACWQMRGLIPMQQNRVAVYPSDRFHSRYPFEGWGTSSRDGRVVIAGFITVGGRDGEEVDSGGDQETGSPAEEFGD